MELRGAQSFRQRLILSTLSGKPLVIKRIRSEDEYPGLADYEMQFVRLLEKLTNGSRVVVNQTGTVLSYTPGLITNSADLITHECGSERSLSYFVEGILPIVIWGKHPLTLVLEGLTHDSVDISVSSTQLETIAAVQLPLLKKIGANATLNILSRGNSGRLELKVSPIKQLDGPVTLTDPGKIKRVRGTAYSARISTQMANRTSYAAKGVMMQFLPDVWIHTNSVKGDTALLGISLSAESNTGAVHAVDFTKGEASSMEGLESDVPEDLGQLAALHLLDELLHVTSRQGGYCDTSSQSLPIILCALGPSNAKSAVLLGKLAPATVELLRLIDLFLGVRFSLSEAPNPGIAAAEDEMDVEDEDAQYEEYDLADPLRENLPR